MRHADAVLEPLCGAGGDRMHAIFTDVDRPARAGAAKAEEIPPTCEFAAPLRREAGLEPGV